MSETRCIKYWFNWWDGIRDLDKPDRDAITAAILDFAFYDEEPKLKGANLAIFKTIKPLIKVYENDKAFAGSLGGAVGGETKSASKVGNQNAAKSQARHNQDTSKTQAKHKQKTAKSQSLNECECEYEREREREGIGPRPSAGDFQVRDEDGLETAKRAVMIDGVVVGYQAPLTLDQVKSVIHSGRSNERIPDEYIERWYADQERAHWVDTYDRAITATQAMRLLAANWRCEKNNPPRVQAACGTDRVTTVDPVAATIAVLNSED